jgi:hypothetical protein
MTPVHGAPPAHDPVGPITRTIEVVSLVAAALLLLIRRSTLILQR